MNRAPEGRLDLFDIFMASWVLPFGNVESLITFCLWTLFWLEVGLSLQIMRRWSVQQSAPHMAMISCTSSLSLA